MADKSKLPTRRAPLSQLFQPDFEPEPITTSIGATVTVTIDGREVKEPLGSTILEAAMSALLTAQLNTGDVVWPDATVPPRK